MLNYQEYKNLFSKITNDDSDIIQTNEVALPKYIETHIRKPLESSTGDYCDWFYYHSPWNQLMAETFHHGSLIFVPSIIYSDIIDHKITDVSKQKGYPFYVIPINPNADNISPVFILSLTNYQQLPLYVRPLASKMTQYSATEIPANPQRCGVFNIAGQTFLFIGKNTMIDHRVQTIALR